MPLEGNEIVTCFVFGKGKLTHGQGEIVVKPKVFEPHRVRKDLSVYRISDLKLVDERSIWFIGKFVEKQRQEGGHQSNLYGRADLMVWKIIDLNLDVVPKEPPPRHANISNFPAENSESLLLQQKLADKAEGFLSKKVDPVIDHILNEEVAVKSEFVGYGV